MFFILFHVIISEWINGLFAKEGFRESRVPLIIVPVVGFKSANLCESPIVPGHIETFGCLYGFFCPKGFLGVRSESAAAVADALGALATGNAELAHIHGNGSAIYVGVESLCQDNIVLEVACGTVAVTCVPDAVIAMACVAELIRLVVVPTVNDISVFRKR